MSVDPATETTDQNAAQSGEVIMSPAGETHAEDAPLEFVPAGDPGDDPLTRNLKRVYAQIAAEPVPSHLISLLEELDQKLDPSIQADKS